MRIAIFCHKFWPAVGGLCTYTGRLAEYLVDRQHDVLVFTSKSPPDAAAREQIARICSCEDSKSPSAATLLTTSCPRC